jgi:hypothetical protein
MLNVRHGHQSRKSAPILICLPGMASNVKRADTSETRSAPLGNDDKLYDQENTKNNPTNYRIPLDHEVAECKNNFTGIGRQ